MKLVAGAVNRLPKRAQEQVYIWGGRIEAVAPRKLKKASAERIAHWVAGLYPQRRYPAVALHHLHDPNQDRLMLQCMTYFRVKRLTLGKAYEEFLRRSLEPGGTIFVVDCGLKWPTTRLGERHLFQFGALRVASQALGSARGRARMSNASPARTASLCGACGSSSRRRQARWSRTSAHAATRAPRPPPAATASASCDTVSTSSGLSLSPKPGKSGTYTRKWGVSSRAVGFMYRPEKPAQPLPRRSRRRPPAAASRMRVPERARVRKAPPAAPAAAMFKDLDKNQDGFISREEAQGSPHERQFATLDKDNDGKLSESEHAAGHAGAATGGSAAPSTGASSGGSTEGKRY